MARVLAKQVDPILLKVAKYMPFAINHNWTPKQVDEEIPAEFMTHWMGVWGIFMEMKAKAQEDAMKGGG